MFFIKKDSTNYVGVGPSVCRSVRRSFIATRVQSWKLKTRVCMWSVMSPSMNGSSNRIVWRVECHFVAVVCLTLTAFFVRIFCDYSYIVYFIFCDHFHPFRWSIVNFIVGFFNLYFFDGHKQKQALFIFEAASTNYCNSRTCLSGSRKIHKLMRAEFWIVKYVYNRLWLLWASSKPLVVLETYNRLCMQYTVTHL